MSLQTSGTECSFATQFGTIRGKRWGTESGLPVLALHGWLDNCASFDSLAPRLNNINLVAIDFLGHGLSDFKKGGGYYTLWQNLHDIHAVIGQLKWSRFAILGHSMGAILGFVYSGTFPESVTRLVCLDALWPLFAPADKAPDILAKSINAWSKTSTAKKNIYQSFEHAVIARCHGKFKLVKSDAEMLARRGVVEQSNGFIWRYDSKLTLPSEYRLGSEHVKAFFTRIKCAVLLLKANNGMLEEKLAKDFIDELSKVNRLIVETVEGGHHFHLSEQTDFLAERLSRYFAEGK